MRANHLILLMLILSAEEFLSAQPATTLPELLMRSQPNVDISAPVAATASFDPPLVRPGEKTIYRVTFNATEVSIHMPEQIAAPAQLNFRESVSGQDMRSAGGAFQMFSTFNYDVHATEPGLFTVPEFTVEVYGRPVVVPAARVEVKSKLLEPREPLRQLLLATSATNVFVGESFNVNVRLPATPQNGVEGVSQMQINGDGFIVDKSAARQTIKTIETNGRNVPTYVYETSVTPIAAGQLQLSAQGFTAGMEFGGPIIISGQISLSSGPPRYVLLESEPLTIIVRPLPVGDELPGFLGAIGNYTCDPPSLATNILKVGEPVELRVVVRGQKNLGRINPPPPPQVVGWQIFPAERGGIVPGNGIKNPGASFNYTLIPLTDALRTTPAIPFSCFDPVLGKYVDLTVPSLPVTVLGNEMQTNADAALMLENTGGTEPEIRLSKLAPAPGWTAGSLVPLQLRGWFPLVQLFPALGFYGLWCWDRRRRFLEQHLEIVRRRQARRALRREIRSLKQAAAAGDAAHFLRCGINALQIASAPHFPAIPQALVCGDVLQILTAAEREGKAGKTVRRFFAAGDAAAFASQAGNGAGLLDEKSTLEAVLAKLEARL
jgi:hypothetical protein